MSFDTAATAQGFKTSDLLYWGALAVGIYFLYRMLSPVIGAVGTAAGAISSGASAASQGIANLWVRLTAAAPMNVLGTVQFPNGSQAPISTLPIKTDNAGGVYTNSNGITYQLQPWISDPNGNPVWPAVAVGT